MTGGTARHPLPEAARRATLPATSRDEGAACPTAHRAAPGAVTVIGAGLAGTEAAWQLATRGVPVTLVEMRPPTSSPHTTPGTSRSSSARTRSRTRIRTRLPGCSSTSSPRSAASSLEVARRTRVPAGSALAVDRAHFSAELTRTRQRAPAHHRGPTRRRPSIPDRPRDRRDRAAHEPGARARTCRARRRRTACVLRRGRSHRRRRVHRPLDRLRGLALRQGGGGRLPQRPHGPGRVRGVPRRARLGQARHGQGVRAHRPLPGMPACRGGGPNGPGCAALRRTQAGRPRRSAHRRAPVGGRATARREHRLHRLQPRRLPDEPDVRRAGTRLSHDSRTREGRVPALRRDAPQHVRRCTAPARPYSRSAPSPASASQGSSPAPKATSRPRRPGSVAALNTWAEITGNPRSCCRRPQRSARCSPMRQIRTLEPTSRCT